MQEHKTLPRKVYFMPTPANFRIIDKLRQFRPMDEINFVPLFAPNNGEWMLEEPNVKALAAIRERRASFIWGDGYSHHLSYYFDVPANGSSVFKLNIDGHLDFCPSFERCSDLEVAARRNRTNKAEFFNHMAFSAARPGYTAATLLPPSKVGQNTEHYIRVYGEPTSPAMIMEQVAFPPDHDIHLTVDFDAVTLFPASSKWVIKDGFVIKEVIDVIIAARESGRLSRLDFGGMINRIPDFNVVCDPGDNKTPSFEVSKVRGLAEANVLGRQFVPWLDVIVSYAVACYYQTLKAAMFD